ncbi:hypothetical protein IB260_12920 [Pseudomonas sp. PDM23]|uniref:hypothetical protein n=1 Tax=unclassified Pseudomonas TaxID=196821 RepID=UPI001782C028|nr:MULTISPECIES: hypothetical protein [unclassified Pseudomonas]MBD9576213.1 hypothetical protein [Pseudomonas sp. PDM23]MBD9670140.1 hypothetical protein [Pseudomonas sp. PDM21]
MEDVKRRSFVSGLLVLAGGLAGHALTKGFSNASARRSDPHSFVMRNKHLNLQLVSQELLLKILSQRVTERDRMALMGQLVNPNRHLIVADAARRQHGVPGFFRVSE